MSNKKSRQHGNTGTKLEDDLADFLKKNKLEVFTSRFAEEGIFTLNDFEMLQAEDIEKIKTSVDGIGYRRRLAHAYDSLAPNSDQKDEESDFSDRTNPTTRKKGKQSKKSTKSGGSGRSATTQRSDGGKPTGTGSPTKRMVDESGPPIVVYFLVFILTIVLLGAAVLLQDELAQVAKQSGLSKRYPGRKIYKSMDTFFSFYLKEHTDATSQLLHVVGTTIGILMSLINPSLLFAQLTGICAGLVAKPFCNGFSSGIVEGLVALFVGQLTAFSLHSWRKLMFCVLIGYGLAWVGHFQFEKNTPATFQAPMFSLLSDYLLTANYVREALMMKKFLLEKAVSGATAVIKPETFGPVLKQIRSLIGK